MDLDNKYEVVIIGAGIGGLVCGCYLAKAGMKVLIIEQHYKAGGYCTSFERKKFKFDVGVHYLGSLRTGGILNKILSELGILHEIDFVSSDILDRIISPDKTIFIWRDEKKTLDELVHNFPAEKDNILNFFNFILRSDFFEIISKTKKCTFEQLLDSFFSDYRLKSILSIMLLGCLGLPPSKLSAFISTILYKEFIFDGGKYPKGGIQVLPDLLLKNFKKNGGSVLFSKKVIKILTKNRKVNGVKLNDGRIINAEFVVSNADATLTFNNLLNLDTKERKDVAKLKPSFSAFVIYLGLNKKLDVSQKYFTTWFFSDYDLDECYDYRFTLKSLCDPKAMLYVSPSVIDSSLSPHGKDILRIFIGAGYKDINFWKKNREKISDKIIKKSKMIFPDIDYSIEVKEIATPHTFYEYTSNRNGALFGWSAIRTQVDQKVFPFSTSVENLHLVGHWVTNGIGQGGVAVVALSGKYVSNLIKRTGCK